jgi:hypothetical protein
MQNHVNDTTVAVTEFGHFFECFFAQFAYLENDDI